MYIHTYLHIYTYTHVYIYVVVKSPFDLHCIPYIVLFFPLKALCFIPHHVEDP